MSANIELFYRKSMLWAYRHIPEILYIGVRSMFGRKEKRRNLQRAEEILTGGLHTLEDYLFLFPSACKKCGCRNIELLTWNAGREKNQFTSEEFWQEFGTTCTRCSYKSWPEFQANALYSPPQSEIHRAYSQYLTKERADEILDFPYNSGGEAK